MRANIETLDNGIDAVFMHRPHWQTSSVYLRVNAGGLHEDRSGPQGVAHYFEHVTFQGSRDFSDYTALNEFCDNHFIDYSSGKRNAGTGILDTTYFVNTYDLEPAMLVVANLALGPTLTDKAIDNDRDGIISEARGVLTQPNRELAVQKIKAVYGDELNRLIVGTPEDVRMIDEKILRAFHERHYRTDNMLLVICSGEDEETQRKLASEITSGFDLAKVGEATEIHLDWLTRENDGVHVFHDERANPESETEVAILYSVEPPKSLRDVYIRNIATMALNGATHAVIRDQLGLSYSASATPLSIINRNFGAGQKYESLTTMTKVFGLENIKIATQALISSVVDTATSEDRIGRILQSSALQIRDEEQAAPSVIASNILSSPSVEAEGYYDTRKSQQVIESISVDEIQYYIREITDAPSQIHATGPDANQLKEYKEWASNEVDGISY